MLSAFQKMTEKRELNLRINSLELDIQECKKSRENQPKMADFFDGLIMGKQAFLDYLKLKLMELDK